MVKMTEVRIISVDVEMQKNMEVVSSKKKNVNWENSDKK